MKSACFACFLCIAACGTAADAAAQGAAMERQYTQQREAAARAADERAHTEAARTNNLPNGSGATSGRTGSGGSSDQAIREMVEGWRDNRREQKRRDSLENDRKWGAYTREVARQAAAEKARLEEAARGIQNMNAEIARRTAEYRQQMDAEGFARGSDELDAFMHELSAVMPGGVSQQAAGFDVLMTYYKQLTISKKAYNAEKQSTGWPVLLEHIYEYTPAWETALTDLDELAGKYPQAVKAVDTARLLSICYFFGLQGDKGRPTYNRYDADEARRTRMALRFGEISARNPGLAISMLSLFASTGRFILRSPVKSALTAYTGKQTDGEKEIFFHLSRTALFTPDQQNNFRTYNWSSLRTKEMDRFWQGFTKEDWNVIFRVQRGSSVNLLESIWVETPSWAAFAHTDGPLSTYGQGDYDNHLKGKWRTTPRTVFEQLATHNNLLVALKASEESGDPDAINTRAVMTAHGDLGKDKSQVVPLLRDAAAKGSLWARWNLVMACGWELEDYDRAAHPAAVKDFERFCDGANAPQLYELVLLMATMKRAAWNNAHEWLLPEDLTLHVLQAAAAKGVPYAVERLKQPHPEKYPY